MDGYGLLHELMADVVEDLSGHVSKANERAPASGAAGALAAADTWLMVSSVSSEVCRSNAAGIAACLACLTFAPLLQLGAADGFPADSEAVTPQELARVDHASTC